MSRRELLIDILLKLIVIFVLESKEDTSYTTVRIKFRTVSVIEIMSSTKNVFFIIFYTIKNLINKYNFLYRSSCHLISD